MSAGNRKSVDRLAATLLALLKSSTGRNRLLPGQHQATREAVNALLGQVGDNVFAEMLQELYRIAEADARKRACGSAAVIRDRLATKRIIVDSPPNPDR
jgi:hypothetical protein